MPTKRIHCLGAMVVDALSGPLEQYPQPKVRTQVMTKHVRFLAGGGAANTSAALAQMGMSAAVFSKVGDDPNGAFLIAQLARHGVDTGQVRVSKADTTPFTFVGIHSDGDRTFIHTPGANTTFAPADLDMDKLLACDFLLFQDVWVLPRLEGAPGAEILAQARQRGVTTLLDECWGFGPNRQVLETMLPHCDYFMPSIDDMRAIYGQLPPDQIADKLLACGVGTVVLKMGAQGCLLASASQRQAVAALAVKVVDTTGAGDCWDAGFLAGLAGGRDTLTAARIGSACASFCIQNIGGAAGIPPYATVLQKAGEIAN